MWQVVPLLCNLYLHMYVKCLCINKVEAMNERLLINLTVEQVQLAVMFMYITLHTLPLFYLRV